MSNNYHPNAIAFVEELKKEKPEIVQWIESLGGTREEKMKVLLHHLKQVKEQNKKT